MFRANVRTLKGRTRTLEAVNPMSHIIKKGDPVRLLGVPDWLIHDLPIDEQKEIKSFIGKIAEVQDIDNYGYYWVGFGNSINTDGTTYYSGHSFCIPLEYIESITCDFK